MSYILDALRRADAERQRGAVPGLHDQAGPAAGATTSAAATAGTARAPWPWLLAGVLLAAAVGGAWWLGRGSAPAPVVGSAAPPVPVQVQVQLTPPPVAALPAPAPPPAPPAPRPAVAAPVAAPAPAPAPAPVAAPVAPPVTAAVPAPAVAPAPAASDPVRAWASLPESTRAALPPLAWSGAVHAERAEQRLVIVNGQVAREGDTIASGVQLLQIRPKSVLLRWQGQRIELPI